MPSNTTAPHQARYTEALEELWDLLSDAVEAGRLTESDIPHDYQALVSQMMTCEARRSALSAH